MKNPFKVGEKVITKVGGKEVEAVVTKLWQNEVQVRTSDNELRWRTVYTAWYPGEGPLAREQKTSKSIGVAVSASSASKPGPVKSVSNTSKPAPVLQPRKTGRAKTKESGKRSRKRH